MKRAAELLCLLSFGAFCLWFGRASVWREISPLLVPAEIATKNDLQDGVRGMKAGPVGSALMVANGKYYWVKFKDAKDDDIRVSSKPLPYCIDTGSSNAYSCPDELLGDAVAFKANSATVGAATISFAGGPPVSIKKTRFMGRLENLHANDILAGQVVLLKKCILPNEPYLCLAPFDLSDLYDKRKP